VERNVTVYLDTAARLGSRLCDAAIWDGARCTWFGASMEKVGETWRQSRRTFGADPYAGTSGVALFLAQLNHFVPSDNLRRTALGAIEQALDPASQDDPQMQSGSLYSGQFGIGFCTAEAGALLEDESVVARGLDVVRANSEGDETSFDIVAGSAGRIGALVRLHRHFGHDWLLELANDAARHLIRTAHRGDRGWSWGFGGTKYVANDLTGYSHGTAGVALALLELHAVTGDDDLRSAADEAIHYERSWFSAEQQNWPDFRRMPTQGPNDPFAYGYAWCHGAPGIGMSRLRAYQLTGRDDLKDEALTALRSTQRTELALSTGYSFGLCHGAAGNAELFLQASEILGDPAWLDVADSIARKGIDDFAEGGQPWPSGLDVTGEAPGLMLGLSGVGYFYLRMHGAAAVPSLLTIS
jgi:lantibiotic modifying enzyme